MFNQIKDSLISAIITAIITLISTVIISFLNGNQGELVFSSTLNNGRYINTFMFKNMQRSEYLKEINLLIDSDINIFDNIIYINGVKQQISDNKIVLDNIKPEKTISFVFYTDEIVDDNKMFLVKNKQKIELQNFNKRKNLNGYVLLIVAIYCLINFVLSAKSEIKIKKIRDEIKQNLKNTTNKLDITEEKIYKLNRNIDIHKTIFLKEMDEMERELNFYQKLLLKNTDKSITKEELEKMISKELKTFSKKKFKRLSYEDVYSVVKTLMEEKNYD